MIIEEKIEIIRKKIYAACSRVGRDGAEVLLIAVTKTVPVEKVLKSISAGVIDIGESRIKEAQSKFAEFGSISLKLKKHLIGHLQTNKAGKAVELFDLIQSVDSLRLAVEINKQAEKIEKIQECLLEVKVTDDEFKYGILPIDVESFIADSVKLKNIKFTGIMAMAPFFNDPQDTRPYFRKAREIFNDIHSSGLLHDFSKLSMGMSNDFEVAVEEGSTMVRVGSAIFD